MSAKKKEKKKKPTYRELEIRAGLSDEHREKAKRATAKLKEVRGWYQEVLTNCADLTAKNDVLNLSAVADADTLEKDRDQVNKLFDENADLTAKLQAKTQQHEMSRQDYAGALEDLKKADAMAGRLLRQMAATNDKAKLHDGKPRPRS